MIAWRYLRARRADGGVGVMTWISLIGVALAVFALVATLAVRSGFRSEFVDTIVGSNAHVTVYGYAATGGRAGIADAAALAARLAEVPGVMRAAPLVRGQVMAAAAGERAAAGDVYGISADDLATIPRVGAGADAIGELARFDEGLAIGSGLARELGVGVGDRIRMIAPGGVRSVLGSSPRVRAFEVVYIFTAGRWDIDRVRIYMPLAEAQAYFNRDGVADEIEVSVSDPARVDDWVGPLLDAAGEGFMTWTWQESAGGFLRALEVEDNVMFVILSILVLIAAMNIVSGLIMLVRNKGGDIGILRTMGFAEGSILRIFFLCGSLIGVVGTVVGIALGCAFAIWIDPIFAFVNRVSGGGVWDPAIRGIYALPAELRLADVAKAAGLSLFLSFIVTIFPARRAARMNPVEALRRG
jgi:lipoprotein-releasing system permease protein